MRHLVVLLPLLLFASALHAAPLPPIPEDRPAPTAAERKRARALVAEGRRLADAASAVQAFLAARALDPRSFATLSELALAFARAGDLENAVAVSPEMYAAAKTAAQRAEAAYNGARIAELAHRPRAAAVLYRRAIYERSSQAVATRLCALFSSTDAVALRGPFASLAAGCEVLPKPAAATPAPPLAHFEEDEGYGGGSLFTYACDDKERPASCVLRCPGSVLARRTAPGSQPFDEVSVFVSSWSDPSWGFEGDPFNLESNGDHVASVAVRLGAAWYVLPSIANAYRANRSVGQLRVVELATKPIGPGGEPRVVLRLHVTQDDRFTGTDYEQLYVIAPGPAPRAIGPIALRFADTGETNPKQEDSESTRDELVWPHRFERGELVLGAPRVVRTVGKKVTRRTLSGESRLPLP